MPAAQNVSHLPTKNKFLQPLDLLRYEELLRIVRIAVSLGMNKLRLTGGEPLIRKGIIGFIQTLNEIEGLDQVRLTTNGVLLAEKAQILYDSGIRHINVSLDTLKAERFQYIAGKNLFEKVWQGILMAHALGMRIKINVVAMRGINDDECIDFAKLALKYPFKVRFIEFMPVGIESSWQKDQFIGAGEIQEKISHLGKLKPYKVRYSSGPARMFELTTPEGYSGSVGFISPLSHHFCDQCNRLRLTSEGKLRACLLSDNEVDLKSIIRSGGSDQSIMHSIRQTILHKPQGHRLQDAENRMGCAGHMSRIGG